MRSPVCFEGVAREGEDGPASADPQHQLLRFLLVERVLDLHGGQLEGQAQLLARQLRRASPPAASTPSVPASRDALHSAS